MQATELTSEALKALIQQDSATLPTRVVAFLAAAALFVAVFEAVRRRKLHENLTPIWITTAVSILVLSVWFDLLVWLTNAIGAWTPSSTVFFLGLMFLTAISLSYAVRLSALSDQVKTLAQELAIVKADTTAAVATDDGGDSGPQ
ncbi:MAG: DUF2304 domain-containing protein [Deltaproteobacteria bacterium]